jgi:hypothetical protein
MEEAAELHDSGIRLVISSRRGAPDCCKAEGAGAQAAWSGTPTTASGLGAGADNRSSRGPDLGSPVQNMLSCRQRNYVQLRYLACEKFADGSRNSQLCQTSITASNSIILFIYNARSQQTIPVLQKE